MLSLGDANVLIPARGQAGLFRFCCLYRVIVFAAAQYLIAFLSRP